MPNGDESTSDDRRWLARLEALVEERLAEYRRTNVYVFDMFIDADDDSTDGPPNLWVARDHYTGELIQRLTGPELDDFYAEHENWVEYSGLVDELEDQLKYEP
jgi:hypothetical protein